MGKVNGFSSLGRSSEGPNKPIYPNLGSTGLTNHRMNEYINRNTLLKSHFSIIHYQMERGFCPLQVDTIND